MKKVINCFKENNPVINKKLRKVSVDEGLSIAKDLFNILAERKDGIGLAANQVGIDAAVAVVNVREPLILINPTVKEQWDEIDYYEGCLSFPKKGVHTKRYKNIIVHTEQEEAGYYFSGVENPTDGKGTWEEESNKNDESDLRLLEAVAVQHEIDHLNGITIHDREYKSEPIKVKKGFGRNEKVDITDGKELKTMKYKKAKPLIDSGEWELYIGGPIT
jgi:peptide deformylase|tara:strand:+ start:2135 stop:2788 length:654 start_codon:yes stop_codon:yes gene_type:complete